MKIIKTRWQLGYEHALKKVNEITKDLYPCANCENRSGSIEFSKCTKYETTEDDKQSPDYGKVLNYDPEGDKCESMQAWKKLEELMKKAEYYGSSLSGM